MRRLIPALLVAAAACSRPVVVTSGPPAGSPLERELRPLLDSALAAAERLDWDGFLAIYDTTDRSLFFNQGEVQGTGRDLVRELEGLVQELDAFHYSVEDVRFWPLAGDAALMTAVTASRGRAGNFEFQDRGVWTALWRKGNGGWRIVHDHTSTSGGG